MITRITSWSSLPLAEVKRGKEGKICGTDDGDDNNGDDDDGKNDDQKINSKSTF